LAFSQGEANSLEGVPAKERILIGGGLGLGFSNIQDFVSISPEVSYRVTARFMAGAGLSYRYTNYKYYSPSVKLHDYGVNPFLRFIVYKQIFIHAETELLNYEFPTAPRETVRKNFTSFLAGAGFFQPAGGRANFYIMALYNFSYRNPIPGTYSAYDSPLVIRAAFLFGDLGL
jgi:hypothetical protein